MQQTKQRQITKRKDNLQTACWLLLGLIMSACGATLPVTPAVSLSNCPQPVKPSPQLMVPPLPAGSYSKPVLTLQTQVQDKLNNLQGR